MSLNISKIDEIGLYTEEDIINLLEKVLLDRQFAKAILEGKDPCKIEKVKQKSISLLHKYIFLYSLFEDIFGHKQKALYKRDKELNLLTKEDIVTYLLQKGIFKNKRNKLEKAINNILKYEEYIRKNKNNFVFTYYQFFAILFTEIFFLFRSKIEDKLKLLLEKNYTLVKEIYAIKKEELEKISEENLEEVFDLLKLKKNKNKLNSLKELLNGQYEKYDLLTAIQEVFKKSIIEFESYANTPLNKLAYYMATGSGKTHILHINLLQAKNYLKNIQKVFLIVPNNDLALQHKINLEQFGLKNIAYIEDTDKNLSKEVEKFIFNYEKENYDLVILTVHQLNSFMKRYKDREIGDFGDNLVFVDEGHKGDVDGWRNDRNKLAGKKGFVFEYSATFAQAIKDNEELIREYSKSIIYYYPYHYFYNDGYGKTPVFYPQDLVSDILENKKIKDNSQKNYELFIQNLLSHYKQVNYYLKYKNNLEFTEQFKLPLSMFVAYRVSSSNKKNSKIDKSDIFQLYEWLNRFITNENNSTINLIKKYKQYFNINENEKDIFNKIITKCFNGKNEDKKIKVWELNKNEIAFSLSTPSNAFAIIYVGDVNSITEFNDIKESANLVSSIMEDFLKDPDSHKLQFLIVGRKLIEGFDTVRINNLSLLNIGKTEGSMVVQLFGRGVRIKGDPKEPLKRENIHPIMERINIFGYNANFLKKFIEETEVLEILEEEEYIVKVSVDSKLLNNKMIPVIEKTLEESNEFFYINKDLSIKNKILAKYSDIIEIDDNGISLLNLVNFKYIYKNLVNNKYSNLLLSYKNIKEIYEFIFQGKFKIKIKIRNFQALNNLILLILNEYISNIYKVIKKEFEKDKITLKPLDITHKNLNFTYSLRIPLQSLLNEKLKKISKNKEINIKFNSAEDNCFESMYLETSNNRELFAIKINNHLYKPLLCKMNNFDISISPDRLEESEIKFLDSFCKFINNYPNKNLTILRNLKSGIGFEGFYPDFIMWYLEKKDNKDVEHIIFLDPKGMTAHNVREVLEKAKLSLKLKELEKELHNKHNSFRNVFLHSFILLNRPLENYLENKEIKDSINNFFAEETMGNIKELNDADIKDLMNIYNIFYLEKENLIEEIINDKLNEKIIDKLKLKKENFKYIYQKDIILKEFLKKFTDSDVETLKKEYNLCKKILYKEEVLNAFLFKYFLGENIEQTYCDKLDKIIEFKDIKEITIDQAIDYFIEILIPEFLKNIFNFVPIAGIIIKKSNEYFKRNKEDLKAKIFKNK